MAIKEGYVSKKKGAKKGTKKKQVDMFNKKEWYTLRSPPIFNTVIGKTLVTRTSAKQNLDRLVLDRCVEVIQDDLVSGATFRKFKFIVKEVKNKEAFTEFNGMELTTDKARGIIKKWHTLIEGNLLVKTSDDYLLRVFLIAQSRRAEDYTKARCYIQTTKVKEIRKMMFEIATEELSCDINTVMKKLCEETVGNAIQEVCSEIYPLKNCYVKKVMVVKRPKRELVEGVEEKEAEENWAENEGAEGNDWAENNAEEEWTQDNEVKA